MKVILTIMCGLVVLFAGGCGLILAGGMGFGGMFSAGPLALLPLGLAVLNGAAIAALWGRFASRSGILLALIIVDAVAVVISLGLWIAAAATANAGDGLFLAIPGLLLAVKGGLTYYFWSKQ